MPKTLKADHALVRHEDGVYLRRQDQSGPWHDLHPLTAATISLFDGQRTEEEIENLMVEGLGLAQDKAHVLLKGILKRFRQYIWEKRDARLGRSENPNENLDPRQFIFHTEKHRRPDRLPAPAVVNWYVTRLCNRRCRYCYAGAPWGQTPHDSTLTTAEVKRIVDEAADIGVHGMMVTGGDPLLRDDVIEIGRYAADSNIHFSITTKQPLNEEQVQLLDHELMSIDFSFDSPFEKTADNLTGSRGYWREMTETMSLFKKYNVKYAVTTVLTALNAPQTPALVDLLYELGASTIRMQKYGPSAGRNSDALIISDDGARAAYEACLDNVAQKGDPKFKVIFDGEGDEFEDRGLDVEFSQDKEPFIRDTACPQGRSRMMFRYDGKVCWCEHLPDDENWIYGDLREQSIMEVWNSDRIESLLHPERALYKNTDCSGCEVFDICNAKTSCVSKSNYQFGSYFVPLAHVAQGCGHYNSPLPPCVNG